MDGLVPTGHIYRRAKTSKFDVNVIENIDFKRL